MKIASRREEASAREGGWGGGGAAGGQREASSFLPSSLPLLQPHGWYLLLIKKNLH